MATEQRLLTADELLQMPSTDMRTELLDGVLVEMSPVGRTHGRVVATLASILEVFVREHQLGEVLAGDPGVILHRNPDRVRAPDVCFTRGERLPDGELSTGFMEFVPDLIIEVISPEDRAGEIREKTGEWLDGGAQLVWTVYPKTRQVVVSRSQTEERIYRAEDTLDAEPLLPGFSVVVAELFAS